MGNRANLNSIHIGHSHAWKSEWFGSTEYQNMLSQDYKIREYLTNIFFNFKLPVSEFNLKRYTNYLMCIDMDLYFPEDIKDKFYLFQNLEDQLYDCIDAIIYYLKNELYLYNISVSRSVQNMKLSRDKTLEASLILFKHIFVSNILMCNVFSIYYKALHCKFVFQYLTHKTYTNFYNLVTRLFSNMFVSKTSSMFATTVSSLPNTNTVLTSVTASSVFYKLSYCMKLCVFISLVHYNNTNVNVKFLKYIIALGNILKIIFRSLLSKELLILLLLHSYLLGSVSKILSKSNLLKFFTKALPDYNLNHTNSDIMLNDYLKHGKSIYNNANYLSIKHEFDKFIRSPSFAIIYYIVGSHTVSETTYFLLYILQILTYVKSVFFKYRELTKKFIHVLLTTGAMPKVMSIMFSYLTSFERSICNVHKYNNLSLGVKTIASMQVAPNMMNSIVGKVYNLLNIKWSIYKFEVVDDYFFRNIIFKQITYHIETTISNVLKLHCIFLPNLYIKDVVPFNSAKLISQYVAYELEKGSPVSEIYRDLKSIHVGDSYKRNEFFKRMYKFTHMSTMGSDIFKSYVSKICIMNPFDVKNQERLDTVKLNPLHFSQFCIQLTSKPNLSDLLNFCNTLSYAETSGLIYAIALSQNYGLYFKNSYMFDLRIASKLKQWHDFISASFISELNSLRAKAPMMYLKKFPVQGVKIAASGTFKRGNEATVKWYSEGKMPRQTVAVDVEQYVTPAFTRNGVIGINVSLFCNTDRFQDEIELKSEEFLDYFKLKKHQTSKHKGSMYRVKSLNSYKKPGKAFSNSSTSLKQRTSYKKQGVNSFMSRIENKGQNVNFNKTGQVKPLKYGHSKTTYKNQRFTNKSKFLKK